MKKIATVTLTVIFSVFLFISCGGEPTPTPPEPIVVPVEGVQLKESTTILEHESETLVATVSPADAANKKVSWSSDKTDIATVDETGKVTGIKAGEATITVTTEDGGKTASCKVTVKTNAKYIPLTLEFPEAGKVTFTKIGNPGELFYSINDGANQLVDDGELDNGIDISANQTISFYRTLSSDLTNDDYYAINCDKECYVYGNVMSLIDPNNFATTTSVPKFAFARLFFNNDNIKNHKSLDLVLPATALNDACYYSMFFSCDNLTKAPALPAEIMANLCYSQMFASCTSLTKAPALPATTLAKSCYMIMFSDCDKLETVPDLPATTLAEACYSGMFYACESLTTAPVLPAPTLAKSCYHSMFKDCSSLNSITCLATDISAPDCTDWWVDGVATPGTFTKASTADWGDPGSNKIPSGWTVQNYPTP